LEFKFALFQLQVAMFPKVGLKKSSHTSEVISFLQKEINRPNEKRNASLKLLLFLILMEEQEQKVSEQTPFLQPEPDF